jgi:16S rRNA (cytosine967-C5)-methyltransferase
VAQISPARKTAFEILVQVEAGRAFAADLLEAAKVSALSEVDRALATEIVMGVLRWRGEIDFQLERLSGKRIGSFDSGVAAALRMGFYQIAFLKKIPKSAAVNESVELTKRARKRSAAGMVNAVLRKCAPSPIQPEPNEAGRLSDAALAMARRAVPRWLLERWETNYGREAAASLAWASVQVPSTTLRVTSLTEEHAVAESKLAEKGIKVREGRYAAGSLVVEQGKGMNSSAARELGLTIQDEASQLVPALLAVRPGMRVLDLCAAPGMKTSLLADAAGGGLVIACDLSKARLRTMQRLLPSLTANLGAIKVVQLNAVQQLPFGQEFDRVLVDASCSGTGTLERNPEIKWRLKPEDLERLSGLQAAILGQALGLLTAGGRLVYATCSLEPEENEKVVESVLPKFPDSRLMSRQELAEEFPRLISLFDSRGYFHTRPDRDGMDGFFAAVIA